MLTDARKGKYAVPMYDVSNYEMIRHLAELAEDMKSPLMLAVNGHDIEGVGLEYLHELMKVAAKRVKAPIVIHLDHAPSVAECVRCIDIGFNSVMIDRSCASIEENIADTKTVVGLSHPKGICVEAELGHVPNAVLGIGESCSDVEDVNDTLTKVEDVKTFVEQTNVDALAVAIGTAHGSYISAPTLDIERLKKINAASKAVLVLHGGSGTPPEQVKEAIANGICKINIYTDLVRAWNTALKDEMANLSEITRWPIALYKKPIAAMKEKGAYYMELFGSAGRA